MQRKQSGMTPSGAMEFNCSVPFSVPSTCKNCSLLMTQQWHNRQLKPLTINLRVWRTDNPLHMQCGCYCLVDTVHRNYSELTATEYPASNPFLRISIHAAASMPSPFLNRGKTAMDSLTSTSYPFQNTNSVCVYVYIHNSEILIFPKTEDTQSI